MRRSRRGGRWRQGGRSWTDAYRGGGVEDRSIGTSEPAAPRPVQSINPFRVFLKHRNFRLFLSGQTLSLVGTWMQTMAQGWLALELTGSAFMVGLVATASSIPVLLFSMPAGAIVDRSDKLRIV